jgi:hypothetical protein
MTNTLAYYSNELITVAKSLIARDKNSGVFKL